MADTRVSDTPDMFLVKDICDLLRPMNVGGMGSGTPDFIAQCLRARLDRIHAGIAHGLDAGLLCNDESGRFHLTQKGLEFIQ